MLLVSLDVFLFSCQLISWLLYSCPVCAASIAGPSVRVHVWLSPRLQFLLFGSCSVLLAYSMLWQSESLSGRESSSPRCHRRTASSVWQAAHCTVHRGHSRRSTVISLCRPLSRALASAAEGADSFTSRSVCLRRGGHPSEARRFRSVGWHSCPG